MLGSSDGKIQVVDICKRMYNRGFISGIDGNVSMRLGGDRIVATPTGMNKGFLKAEDIVVIDLDGNLVEGKNQPSSEIQMHLRVYLRRLDVKAVVHAHPPTSTGFSVAGKPFSACVLPEMVLTIGWVPIVPYGTPGTNELPDALEPYLSKHDALLLANHGALTMGSDLTDAYNKMESLEHTAKIILVAQQLGNINLLSKEDVDKLMKQREDIGSMVPHPGCQEHGLCSLSQKSYPGYFGDPVYTSAETKSVNDIDPEELKQLEDVITETIVAYLNEEGL